CRRRTATLRQLRWHSMEMMVVKCMSCKATLKFSAEKAGTKIQCPKCNAEVALPKGEDTKPKRAGDDDDDAGGYQLAFVDDELERRKREEAHNRKAEKKEKM